MDRRVSFPQMNKTSLLMMTFVGGLISVYDNVLNLLTMKVLVEQEQNPVASLVIDGVGVESFIMIKAFTTIAAVFIMIGLIYSKWRIAIVPTFVSQCGLFCYLTFYAESEFWSEDIFTPLKMVVEFYVGH